MNTRNTLYVKDGKLYIGGFAASELAHRFGTPLYVMDAAYIAEVCDAFQSAMATYGDGAVAFANKAFATVATAKIAAKHGLWFDVVSGGELYLVKSAGADLGKVLFHGNNKTVAEIEEGIADGVGFFVVDSLHELELLDEKAGAAGVVQDILVRVNPGITAHTHEAVATATPLSKFGFGVDTNAFEVIKDASQRRNLHFRGIHSHIGSQIYDHSSYDAAIGVLTDFMKRLYDEAGIVNMGVVAMTKTGNYIVFSNAAVIGKGNQVEKNIGLGVTAVALDNPNEGVKSDYLFDGSKVDTAGG